LSSDLNLGRRRRRRGLSPVFVLICLAAVISLIIAAIWQAVTPPEEKTDSFQFDPKVLEEYGDKLPSSVESSSSLSEESLPETSLAPSEIVEPSSEPEPSTEEPVDAPDELSFGKPVPEMPERVKSEYFDDAVFIGDSITTGISLYDVMSNAEVYASTGVGISNVLTKEIATVDGANMTIPAALEKTTPGKIYILLGANSLAGNLDDVANEYSRILDRIIAASPESIVYVQSVFPINEEIYGRKYNGSITNETIRTFNEKLMSICGEKSIYYLDLYSLFADENGELSNEVTADGLHIFSAKYLDWFDYLKTHAVQP